MAFIGKLLRKGFRVNESLEQEFSHNADLQKAELKKLLIQARETEFGKYYNFQEILRSFKSKTPKEFYRQYTRQIPIFDYNSIYDNWWHLLREGQKDITWPGKVKYFALSSGTSGAPSKNIPVTKEMLKAIQKTSIRQILSLQNFKVPPKLFMKGILMLGGSTHLNRNGSYFEGDLSGITTSQIPFWFQHHYKPGRKISKTRDWDNKLEEIAGKADKWDIGYVVGVPAWIQILMEKIIDKYQLNTIHDIWPDLSVYVHGGVSFEPYKKGFEKLLAKPLTYIETYLASEGFIAFQARPERGMKMVLNNGIFFEFVPFTEENFTQEGEIKPNAEAIMIDEVEEGKEYALLLSTCAGAWRYMIGDTIRFLNLENAELCITGRTKHFLSLCGEHLSVDNMNKAIKILENDLNIDIKEFTVAGQPYQTLFSHHWFLGTDDNIEPDIVKQKLDSFLKELNDDYKVERQAALKEIFVNIIPASAFYKYMEMLGKVGAQNKFPRVLKKKQLDDWLKFLKDQGIDFLEKIHQNS